MKSKRVYISTPLKPEKFRLDLIQEVILQSEVFAFIPTTALSSSSSRTADLNKLMIELSDEVWVFGAIGRDCAWEMGYASALNIPVRFFKTSENEALLPTDWMLFTESTQIEDLYSESEDET